MSRGAVIGDTYSSRHNSLNFLRLVLAIAVIAGHALDWGAYGSGEGILRGKTTIGTVAVFGFFGISGYLIAASASHNNLGRYLWKRVLRIFPAFWVCLLVMVFFFGAIGFTHTSHPPHCGLSCYVQHRGIPYVAHNFLLRLTQPSLGPDNLVKNGQFFDGQLWTLFYEFLCYLALGALAVLGLLKRRAFVGVLTLALWVTELVVAIRPHVFFNFDVVTMLMLGPVFLTGTLVYLYRDRVRDSGVLALISSALFVASMWLPIAGSNVSDRPTSVDLLAPLVVYPLLWLGNHLPLERVGSRNDYSYGIYIYGSAVLALLNLWGVSQWGYVPYLLLSVGWTFCFAAASWWLVERHALRLKNISPRVVARSLFPART
jgi:peptidoglycan/LPS O-acetylase OafA/YrhL